MSARKSAASLRAAISPSEGPFFGESLAMKAPDAYIRPWPEYTTIAPEYIHAVGAITINYNHLERALQLLILFHCPEYKPLMSFVFEKSSNDTRIAILDRIANSASTQPEDKEYIEHFAAGYNACTFNRNIVVHSEIHSMTETPDFIVGMKRTKRNSTDRYDFTLEELRRIADEMHEWYVYAHHFLMHVISKSDLATGPELSLPQKPAVPSLLAAKSLPNPQLPEPPPRSSRA